MIKESIVIVMANEIKTKGVSLLDKLFEKTEEVIISVRGRNKYAVIDIERYKRLRALELDRAYEEAMEDIKAGNYTTDIEEHLRKLDDALRS